MENDKKKMGYVDFFETAILKLRNASKSKGIHSVWSGFNQAFREYFGGDPIRITQDLAKKGLIEIRPARRGVMIYLPGEAPISRKDLGKEALSKILGAGPENEVGLIDRVLKKIAPNGSQIFPDDFLTDGLERKEMLEVELPGTLLKLDPNSPTTVTSPKRTFRYEAENPYQAKYIVYAFQKGQKNMRIPKDNHAVFKLVADYEKYCKKIREQAYAFFLEYTSDEDTAEALVKELEKKLDLRFRKS